MMHTEYREEDVITPEQDHAQDDDDITKRRRIARACDMCRKKKIRCDGDSHRW